MNPDFHADAHLLPRCRRRLSNDQACRQFQLSGNPRDAGLVQFERHFYRFLSQGVTRLADGGQKAVRVTLRLDVVESDQRNVFRHPYSFAPQLRQRLECDAVVLAPKGGRSVLFRKNPFNPQSDLRLILSEHLGDPLRLNCQSGTAEALHHDLRPELRAVLEYVGFRGGATWFV